MLSGYHLPTKKQRVNPNIHKFGKSKLSYCVLFSRRISRILRERSRRKHRPRFFEHLSVHHPSASSSKFLRTSGTPMYTHVCKHSRVVAKDKREIIIPFSRISYFENRLKIVFSRHQHSACFPLVIMSFFLTSCAKAPDRQVEWSRASPLRFRTTRSSHFVPGSCTPKGFVLCSVAQHQVSIYGKIFP